MYIIFLDWFVHSYIERVFRIFIELFFVIISISIYIFGIYLILVLSNCNAIQSTDCHVRYFNKLSIYLYILEEKRVDNQGREKQTILGRECFALHLMIGPNAG